MTISLRGSATGLAGGTTTALAFTLPTGVTTNDLMLALVGTKPFGNSVSSGTLTTDGWTAQSAGSNGTTANGIDVGSVWAVIYSKVHDGSEVAPTGTLGTTPSPRMSGMLALQSNRTGSGWSVTSTNGSDSTVTGTGVSITGAANLDVAVGDVLVVLVVHKTDGATHTSPALSVSGATITNLTQRFATTTTTSGNDGAMYVYTADVTVGATAAPVFTVTTLSGSSDAQAVFLRIREPQNAGDTVAATTTSSGTVVGKEGHRGLVSATITSSATVTGGEHHFGTVSATTTSSATVVGREGHRGLVSATITSSGTVTPSEHHAGTVSATSTSSGTVAGSEGHRGLVTAIVSSTATVVGSKAAADTVSATITSTGIVIGGEHHFGQVSGTTTSSATVTGTKFEPGDDRFGTVHATLTATGIAAGSKATAGTCSSSITSTGTVGPVPPAPTPEPATGGGRNYYRLREWEQPAVIARSGRVRGYATSRGATVGRRGAAASVSSSCTLTSAASGRRSHRGLVRVVAPESRSTATGQVTAPRDSEYLLLYAEVRRLSQENELLLIL